MGKKIYVGISLAVLFILAGIVWYSMQNSVHERMGETKELTQDTIQFYRVWKEKYLFQDTYVSNEEQFYIRYMDKVYIGNGESVPVTVSEAHGYGMLIMACMADYDEDAKKYFDGMYRYYKSHLSNIGPNLMSWQQCDNGTALIDGAIDGSMTGGPCDSATDGDLDIAYALLMADKIWGSDGDINYRTEAIALMNDIMTYEVNQEYWILTLGDWTFYCNQDDPFFAATRSSDFIVQYFPIYAEVTGDNNWLNVYDRTYTIINSMVKEDATGLLPDFFICKSEGEFVPAPAYFLESEYDGNYYYNSCRTPWRISMDYLMNHNEDARRFAQAVTNFIEEKTKGNPSQIKAGYELDGSELQPYSDLCFAAPFLVAAKCTERTEWHDALREYILDYGEDVYYGDTIKLISLIVDDDGWINCR